MSSEHEFVIRYRFATGEIKKITVSKEIAKVYTDAKKEKKKHEMRQLRHGSKADLDKVMSMRSAALLTQAPPSVEDIVLINELSNTILCAMETLTETQRRRLFLRFFMDCSMDEIAQMENVAKQSVWESITTALKKLKKQIQLEEGTA